LPGVGKTSIARELARAMAAVYLRIDTIDHVLLGLGLSDLEDITYKVGYAQAAENLRLGRSVVADCVNDMTLTRDAWRAVGEAAGVPTAEIEIVCSDPAEHRRRVETRVIDIEGFKPPTWAAVEAMRPEPWTRQPIVIDTAGRALADCVAEVSEKLG
jgi:predicted kinase